MSKTKVLVVENELLIALNLHNNLEENGYDVTYNAISGENAVQLAESEKPDVILMDICLSGNMDGFSAAENIRKFSSVPIIFLSGIIDKEGIFYKQVFGPFTILKKPFTMFELLSTIKSVINLSTHFENA